uniref:Uncharacterized protein n=1 Tax=Arundo donax TaxID=35708 RepID=A0A0A8ZV55_ARUDO
MTANHEHHMPKTPLHLQLILDSASSFFPLIL